MIIIKDKTVYTNVEKTYEHDESERSKQTSNICAFIHIPKLLFFLNITVIFGA